MTMPLPPPPCRQYHHDADKSYDQPLKIPACSSAQSADHDSPGSAARSDSNAANRNALNPIAGAEPQSADVNAAERAARTKANDTDPEA